MSLGGGIWVTQNKKLPGAYINFVSAARASTDISERGYAAMPLELSWGQEGKVFTVTQEDFMSNSQKIFGYSYDDDKMKGLRDLFKNCKTLYAYRLNTGVKASNTFATAKHGGVRGNDIKIVITVNVDDGTKYDVKTYLGLSVVDSQLGVANVAGLVDNDFVTFKSDATLSATAGTPMTGGTDGSTVTGDNWTAAFNALESYSFNTLGVVTTTETVKALAKAYTDRLRDQVGVKFQTVVYQYEQADDKAIISVENQIGGADNADLVYWVTGAQAGCEVNKSLTNTVYDGEYDVTVTHTQTQLSEAIDNGMFIFHKVGDDVRVLTDINTKTTVSLEEGDDFKSNQTIRVVDQIGNDIATLFNTRFLGIIPNDDAGRISLWNEITKHHQELQRIRAIENFLPEDVTVSQGDTKKDVIVNDAVQVVNAMERLYMVCVVS